jgi:hypothetical protein
MRIESFRLVIYNVYNPLDGGVPALTVLFKCQVL